MLPKVPFLKKEIIEEKAYSIIEMYNFKFPEHRITAPPIPIESIIESLFELELQIEDLKSKIGNDDVLGATYIKYRKISIDESIINNEGRYNFTCAHEIGHWVLHRDYIVSDENQMQLFDFDIKPSIICRTSMEKESIEWQADYFAANLLMPKKMIVEKIIKKYGSIDNFTDKIFKNKNEMLILAGDLKNLFKVSKKAMEIRLNDLKFASGYQQLSLI